MKVDIFAHIVPLKYKEALQKQAGREFLLIEKIPTLFDLDERFRIMDKYDGLVQVLTVPGPAVESVAGPKEATELARRANEEVAELVVRYPEQFVAGVATLPMNDMDAALKEADRAIKELRLRGVMIHTPINGKPIDLPEFMPLYEKMAGYNLPIWIHPRRELAPDYASERESKYWIWLIWGWPFETTVAMTRLVFSGVLEKYPNLKFITHHCGAMVPYFERRIAGVYALAEMLIKRRFTEGLTKPPIEYFRMFYNDTAVQGSIPSLMCAYNFFGAEHVLFGTDMPYDSQLGDLSIRDTIQAIEQMDIPNSDKQKIFEGNARKLLRLPL